MIARVLGLVALATLATIPLKGVRVATNLPVLRCSIFLAGQIALTTRAPVDPVTVGSPGPTADTILISPILTVAT